MNSLATELTLEVKCPDEILQALRINQELKSLFTRMDHLPLVCQNEQQG